MALLLSDSALSEWGGGTKIQSKQRKDPFTQHVSRETDTTLAQKRANKYKVHSTDITSEIYKNTQMRQRLCDVCHGVSMNSAHKYVAVIEDTYVKPVSVLTLLGSEPLTALLPRLRLLVVCIVEYSKKGHVFIRLIGTMVALTKTSRVLTRFLNHN